MKYIKYYSIRLSAEDEVDFWNFFGRTSSPLGGEHAFTSFDAVIKYLTKFCNDNADKLFEVITKMAQTVCPSNIEFKRNGKLIIEHKFDDTNPEFLYFTLKFYAKIRFFSTKEKTVTIKGKKYSRQEKKYSPWEDFFEPITIRFIAEEHEIEVIA